MIKREIFIPIVFADEVPPDVIREICAGLEEEGVPYQTQQWVKASPADRPGVMAAYSSPMHVSIGVDTFGSLALYHDKLDQGQPYLQDKVEHARRVGKNAARLVKGLPLYLT